MRLCSYRDYIIIGNAEYSGPVDSNKTVFLDKTGVLIMTRGVYSAMNVIPMDSFGNKTDIKINSVEFEIRKVLGSYAIYHCLFKHLLLLQDSKDGLKIHHEFVAYKNDQNCYEFLIKVDEEGHYVGWVKYKGRLIGPSSFTILSLSGRMMVVSCIRLSMDLFSREEDKDCRGECKEEECAI